MEKDQDLKNLFKAFEDHAPELISLESAEKIISQKQNVKPHKTRKIMQTTFIATIGLSLSLFLIKSYTPSELIKPSNTIQSQSSNEQISNVIENSDAKTFSINEPSSKPSPISSSFVSSNPVDVKKTLINPYVLNPISSSEYDSIPSQSQIKDTAKTTAINNSVAIQKSKYNFINLASFVAMEVCSMKKRLTPKIHLNIH